MNVKFEGRTSGKGMYGRKKKLPEVRGRIVWKRVKSILQRSCYV